MKRELDHNFVVFLEPSQFVILINMSNQWVVDQCPSDMSIKTNLNNVWNKILPKTRVNYLQ